MIWQAVTVTSIGSWFCTGFFVGLGWFTASWVIDNTLRRIPNG